MHDAPDISLRPVRLMALHSLVCLVFLYFTAALLGLSQLRPRGMSGVDDLASISIAFCLAIWALEDDRRRHGLIPMLSRPWFLLFAGILVPGYVIWSRGWRGVGWVALHFFGCCVVLVIAHAIGTLMLLRL